MCLMSLLASVTSDNLYRLLSLFVWMHHTQLAQTRCSFRLSSNYRFQLESLSLCCVRVGSICASFLFMYIAHVTVRFLHICGIGFPSFLELRTNRYVCACLASGYGSFSCARLRWAVPQNLHSIIWRSSATSTASCESRFHASYASFRHSDSFVQPTDGKFTKLLRSL